MKNAIEKTDPVVTSANVSSDSNKYGRKLDFDQSLGRGNQYLAARPR